MASFTIVRATMADRPRVVAFLRKAFYKYEPLNIAMGLTDEPSDADINHSLQSFPQGNSLLAVTSENEIVGVAINGEITDNEANVRQKLFEECDCKDFVTFLKFWVHVERTANFWKNTDEPKALDLEIMAVDPDTRGQGIGNALMTKTKELAKEVGFKVFRVDCSSFYAGKLAELQGMICVFEMNYDDYKDENGEIVFKIPAPHKSLRIFMQNL